MSGIPKKDRFLTRAQVEQRTGLKGPLSTARYAPANFRLRSASGAGRFDGPSAKSTWIAAARVVREGPDLFNSRDTARARTWQLKCVKPGVSLTHR